MGKIVAISVLVLLLGITEANADIVELTLAAEGRYDVNSGPWEMDFDLGVTFTEISHVYMDWSGEITAGLAFDDTTPGPQPFPLDVGISAYLGPNPWPRLTDVYGGEATYPEPEGFDSRTEFGLPGSTTWSDLLDGHGTLQIDYAVLGGPYVIYVESGFVDLNSATLIVEGTPVPEPATVIFLALGVLGFCMGRRER
ncbi:MAG: PEP-CTERM sorting domain-containing protein [Planctomycetes bacterium]|nr:PEP-CTERM sorting domain-containing protein [Planctomycetota bacterium]